MFHRDRRDDRGASAVEYGLLIAGIAGIIFAVIFVFGGGVDGLLVGSCDKINQEINAASC